MTYCIGIKLDQNLVFLSDSRTSAGVDNISTYSKMWRFGNPGDRQLVLCSSGNLATTQAVIAILKRDIKNNHQPNLMTITSMHEGAEYIGKVNVECAKKNTGGGSIFESTFIFGGEIAGEPPGLYIVYSQGNFISSSRTVPYLQIGEFKYGKPILDRVLNNHTPLARAIICALLSMDATMKSNLTVGPPLEICILNSGTLQEGKYLKFEEDNEYMRNLRNSWNKLVEESMDTLESPIWL